MPTLRFTKGYIPTPKELHRLLDEAQADASPLDDFAEAIRRLSLYEQRYKMDSADFYARFQRGEMGDSIDFMRWATAYEIYDELRGELSTALNLLSQYAIPVAV